jgi:hypothetical protein
MKYISFACIVLMLSCTKSTETRQVEAMPQVPFDSTMYTIGNNGRYNSFGNLFVKDSSNIGLTLRSGTGHLSDGIIEWMNYNIDSAKWSGPVVIATPEAGYDFRDPRASVIEGKTVVFTSKYITATASFESMGYFINDGKWSGYNILTPPAGLTSFMTYGPAIKSDVKGIYYASAYGFNGTLFSVWLWKISFVNGKMDVSRIDVYSGTRQITESGIVRLGDGKFLLVSRVNNRNQMVQFNSVDGGLTWSKPIDTDMGVDYKTAPSVPSPPFVFNNKLHCLYQDRNTGFLMMGTLTDSWHPVIYYKHDATVVGFLGYPSAVVLPRHPDRVMFSWSYEIKTGAANIKVRQDCCF